MKTKILLISLLLLKLNSFCQEITYNLILKDPCSNEIEYGKLYYLSQNGKNYFTNDSIGTIILPEEGTYKVIDSFNHISQKTIISSFKNSDTLRISKIKECIEPTSNPNFLGFCCCENKCDGYQVDYYNNGNKRIEGEFKDGLPIGKIIEYYENGKVMSIRFYNEKGILKKKKKFE